MLAANLWVNLRSAITDLFTKSTVTTKEKKIALEFSRFKAENLIGFNHAITLFIINVSIYVYLCLNGKLYIFTFLAQA